MRAQQVLPMVLGAVLAALFVLVGLRESSVLGFTGVGRVLFSLCHAFVLWLPLLALVGTGTAIARARERGAQAGPDATGPALLWIHGPRPILLPYSGDLAQEVGSLEVHGFGAVTLLEAVLHEEAPEGAVADDRGTFSDPVEKGLHQPSTSALTRSTALAASNP